MRNYEQQIFSYMDAAVRNAKISPMLLGGVAGSGGGIGGNPGGFIGYLPQTRVAYDESELETLVIPASGMSLLDNLNRIRYRLASIEAVTSGGVNVLENDATVLLGARTLNFVDAFDVFVSDTSEVTIAPAVTGELSDTTYSGVYGESFDVVASGTQQFTVLGDFDPTSLAVYWNGNRVDNSDLTVLDVNSFELALPLMSGDSVSVDYLIPHEGYFHSHHQYLTSGDTYTRSDLDYFLSLKADNLHYHTEADILNLNHDAVSIRGFAVYSGIAPDNFHILQFNTANSRFETVVAEFEQQIILPAGPQPALSTVGIMPLRVYVHDVGSNAVLTKVFAYVNTAPAVDMEFDVLKNGTATASLIMGAGNNTTSTTSFIDAAIAEDDYLQLEITSGDSVAEYLTVHVRFVRRF